MTGLGPVKYRIPDGHYCSIASAAMITPRSIKTLIARVGMVIFVGSAARLVTTTAAIAVSTMQNRIRFIPTSETKNKEIGARAHP